MSLSWVTWNKDRNWRTDLSWISLFQCSVRARRFGHRNVSVLLTLSQLSYILGQKGWKSSQKPKQIPILFPIPAISDVFPSPNTSHLDLDLVFSSISVFFHCLPQYQRHIFNWLFTTAGVRNLGTIGDCPISVPVSDLLVFTIWFSSNHFAPYNGMLP